MCFNLLLLCMIAVTTAPTKMKIYPVNGFQRPGKSELICFFMTLANCDANMEFIVFATQHKHVNRHVIAHTSKITPTHVSDNLVPANAKSPLGLIMDVKSDSLTCWLAILLIKSLSRRMI
jgi:hypothetical protein